MMARLLERLRRGDPLSFSKAKVVADALSGKSASLVAFMVLKEWQLLEQIIELNRN